MSIKVLIADDHHVVRRGLVFFLKTQSGIDIVGEASNGKEAVAEATRLKPDVVLMDLDMPIMNGVEATCEIKKAFPNIHVMILTSFSDQEHVIPALEAGASGYQLKDVHPDELVKSIKQLVNGESQIHPKATTQLLSHYNHKKMNPLDELTNRERDVLKEITKGKSNKEISASLFITEKTVKTHVSNILSKLEVADRTQAALLAVRNGFK
ncbi:response regulator [Cytobacillus purgationiresistens]|uniref:DNA-binding NarL/FixJ family response regulator n=1 Tax=Cytobacillus purgationiresistens TaxID=863449 RepID=A0ABU0AEX7_9BACI|nr:response regulator transcription factor [Cytobacillus purgationiresistens]MDQ0268998.1 DNA-binding NarL/FixJ family response regulator [Cytobacillus purgationiresistens]